MDSAGPNSSSKAVDSGPLLVHKFVPSRPKVELLEGLPDPIIYVVSSVDLACSIELRKVVMYIRNAEYNPRRFTGCVIRLREPRVTCLLFSTGKMVTTGGRSEESNNLGARKCARVIQKLGFPVQFNNFRIQNVVGIVDLKFPIRLEGLLMANEQMSQYEPEIFPGLIYRIINPKLVFLIFVNGKVIITGAKSVELVYEALNKVYPVLRNFRKMA
ncbi:TATA box-binding protein-like 2 [Taenia solium]